MRNKSFPSNPILIVDDEEDVLQSYKMTLRFNGINNFVLCSDSRRVMDQIATSRHSVVILDLSMPHVSGRDLLSSLREKYPAIPIIVVTASNDVATAVECMKQGAKDYMVKPVEESRLISGLRNILEKNELQDEIAALKQVILNPSIKNPGAFSHIITMSHEMYSIFGFIEAVASTTNPVLVTGESGTGKELIARALHNVSGRNGKFVPVNVGGLDDAFFSDTLFGHRKGAFSGAEADRRGLVEEAENGTLFLDEIGSMDKTSQTKLLRFLDEKEYYTLGDNVRKTARTSVIAATNEDLQAKMKDSLFRNDLFYRLQMNHIHIPPLRARREDIPALIDHFLDTISIANGKPKQSFPPELPRLLDRYDFPGNVRELKALISEMAARSRSGVLDSNHAREYLSKRTGKSFDTELSEAPNRFSVPYTGDFPKLREVEDFLVCEAIKTSDGNLYKAADKLGVAQSTLWRRTKK
jgi:DNA-binding NtrC family response regulator